MIVERQGLAPVGAVGFDRRCLDFGSLFVVNSEGKLLAVESHLSLELGKGSVLEPGNHFDVVVRRCLVAVADNHPFGNTKVVLTAVVGAAVVPSMGFVVDQVVDSVRYIGLHRQLSHHKVGYWAFFALELQDE